MNIDRLHLGTWQFENLDDSRAAELIVTAQKVGICKFDTAAVYASGRSETLLGQYTDPLIDTIVTKIPSVSKSELDPELSYSSMGISESIGRSIRRLKRPPEVVLLHNWHREWDSAEGTELIKRLRHAAMRHMIGLVGISIPNGYDGSLQSLEVLSYIDYIELPYNDESPAITPDVISELVRSKRVLVRSLFKHGVDTTNMSEKIHTVLATGADVVIGASKPEHIEEWSRICQ